MTNPKPVVAWRVTRSCNLGCLSCHSDSRARRYGAELTTPESMALISHLAAFAVLRMLFAGGEPLMRAGLLRLVAYTHVLKGRCADCRWKQAGGGNLQVRAEEFLGDLWMSDPACYLTDKEISKEVTEQVEAMEDDVLLSQQAA